MHKTAQIDDHCTLEVSLATPFHWLIVVCTISNSIRNKTDYPYEKMFHVRYCFFLVENGNRQKSGQMTSSPQATQYEIHILPAQYIIQNSLTSYIIVSS